jgi:hypothetical protein
MRVCDLIGRLPTSGKGKKIILVAVDHYSKWVETKTLKTKDMKSILRAIKEIIIDKHGTPTKILSDCGLEFKNQEIANFAQQYGIN